MRNGTFGHQEHIYRFHCKLLSSCSLKEKRGEQLEREVTPTATTKIQHSVLRLFLLEVKVNCFILGQSDCLGCEQKRGEKEETAFCCA